MRAKKLQDTDGVYTAWVCQQCASVYSAPETAQQCCTCNDCHEPLSQGYEVSRTSGRRFGTCRKCADAEVERRDAQAETTYLACLATASCVTPDKLEGPCVYSQNTSKFYSTWRDALEDFYDEDSPGRVRVSANRALLYDTMEELIRVNPDAVLERLSDNLNERYGDPDGDSGFEVPDDLPAWSSLCEAIRAACAVFNQNTCTAVVPAMDRPLYIDPALWHLRDDGDD